jgi:RNA polymerase sigma-70 factor (ECF subfamily)
MKDAQTVRQLAQELTALQRPLYLYITTLVGHPADAEDILQEVNRLMWEKLDEYQPQTSLAAWACKIAYYEVLTFRKRKAREGFRFSESTLEQLAPEAERLLEAEDARTQALRHCLEALPEADRELITRRYLGGLDMHSLARCFSRSEKSLYRSLARIRTVLLGCVQRTLATEMMQ